LNLEQLVEELEKAAAFEERWGYLLEFADNIRKLSLFLPWKLRVPFLLWATVLEMEYKFREWMAEEAEKNA
jgi:hypothetical protein